MDTSKVIRGVVNSGRYTVTAPIVKEDYGLYLQIEGVELPQTYEVDFSNSENSGTSVTMIGNSDGVLIPHQFISTGKDIFAFLYHVGTNYGRTVYKFRIPNKLRPDRTEETPTPEEQSVIDQAISALNTAVAQTAQDVIDADASAQSAQGYAEQAETARNTAQTYANNAQTSATQASASASQASTSATASAQSASEAETARQATTSLVAEAQGYANASAQSATASANSAEQAESAKGVAQSYAQDAQTSATYASVSESTANAKAQDASGYAQTATQKATESAQSASQALTYKTDAESAKVASQTAQGLAESARDSAVSAKTDAESARDDAETARDEAQSAVASISGALAEKAPVITDTASGSIASFTDGADDLPLKSLVVDINPIQDLRGYDSPWPAGGGKNILPYAIIESPLTKNGITFVRNQDGSIAVNGTSTASFAQAFVEFSLQPGSYYFNCGNSFSMQQNTYVYIRDTDNRITLANIIIGNIGIDRAFSIDVQTNVRFYMVFGQTDLVISGTLYPMIRLASVTDATYSPYENLCPISGWTEVTVNHSDADMTNPTTLTISLGQTVYGGKLDVLSGELTVYPYYASYNGETLTGEWISDRDKYVAGTTPTIGAQVVNIGAQGVTVQLEPHEVASLLGQNNIFADTGDTTCEYRADTKAYIAKKIAEALASLT